MKTLLTLAAALAASIGSTASAAPLISVTKSSGYVLPEHAYRVECLIQTDITTVRIRRGESESFSVRRYRTAYTSLVPNARRARGMISAAARGRIQMRLGPTDLPTATYLGIIGSRRITLLNDQSHQIFRNTAPGVGALLAFADRNCPTPVDAGSAPANRPAGALGQFLGLLFLFVFLTPRSRSRKNIGDQEDHSGKEAAHQL
jgi:hypothetical protein